jgi:hypothetical protein
MAEPKYNRLEKWVLGNQEKALAIFEKHKAEGEEVIYYATGWTGPHYIWTLILGNLLQFSKKKFLLAVTPTKFMMIGIKKFTIEEITYLEFPVAAISQSVVKGYPLGAHLVLILSDRRKFTYKDMSREWADGLKEAIDKAQGKDVVAAVETATA